MTMTIDRLVVMISVEYIHPAAESDSNIKGSPDKRRTGVEKGEMLLDAAAALAGISGVKSSNEEKDIETSVQDTSGKVDLFIEELIMFMADAASVMSAGTINRERERVRVKSVMRISKPALRREEICCSEQMQHGSIKSIH